MAAITVGRLDHQIVRVVAWSGVEHGRTVIAAKITGEDQSRTAPIELDGSSAQDVARVTQAKRGAAGHGAGAVKRYRRQVLQRVYGVSLRIKRERWFVLGEAVAIRKFGVPLLKMACVRQQDAAKVRRRLGALHRAGETLLHQQGQIAGVIKMGMGEDDGLDAAGINGKPCPVPQA